ncbi:MerR family transcriptional regulator [Aeoliella mucimassa]|uniref:Helix-turn-helix domain protein n=1 Tax=Aeoliella mucimassa TaxID=2527972 RepID=A0A518ANM8_9BACT|nr:hypothetical protein [Aeoliella mucimassa]QDU56335.1 hypothetical protein Pan181_25440 [Aeoliella mucimassa]
MSAPMRTPPPPRDDSLRGTLTIEAYARRQGLTQREVRQMLGTGKVPFVQVRGQIRVPIAPATDTGSDSASESTDR